jgi:hypothetical protein
MTSSPPRATIGLFIGSFVLSTLRLLVCEPLFLVISSDYTRPSFYTSMTIGLLVITPLSILFGIFVWYYNRSKKEQ